MAFYVRLARFLRTPLSAVFEMSWIEVRIWMEEDKRFPLGPETQYAQLGAIQHAIYQSQAGKKQIDWKKYVPLLCRRFASAVDQKIADWFGG